jgi:glycosyltransferase involved in cell wall biosynthesis
VLLAAAQPDVVHAVPTPPSAVVAAKQGARLAGAPLVVGWEGHERPAGRLLGRAARAPDRVVVPSGLVGTRARKAGTPERRVRTLPQPIDFERVEAVTPTGDYDVVAATPLDEHANLDGLFLALAELRERDWSALVVGDGTARRATERRPQPGDEGARHTADGEASLGDGTKRPTPDGVASGDGRTDGVDGEEDTDREDGADERRDPTPREAIDRQVADLRIDDRVTVVDDMGRDERLAHYRGAHVFVQTRAREDFARELLWALACGCVGVVEYQADSSAHELLVDYDRGFRVTTPEEIEAAITDAGEMERRTVDRALARYDWSPTVERYVDQYRELAENE